MNFKYMVICGEDVTAAVFTDKTGTEMVRFQVEGTWHGPRDPDKCPKHLFITDFKDGSFLCSNAEVGSGQRCCR